MHKSLVLSKKNEVKPTKPTSWTSHFNSSLSSQTHTYICKFEPFLCCVNAVMNIWVPQNVGKFVTGYDPVISSRSNLLRAGFSLRLPVPNMGRDCSVGIANRYGLEGPEIESRWGGGGRDFPQPSRLRWSRGSVLAFSTQVRGFKPGRSRRIFMGRKNPQHAFLRRGSKAVGPMSQICGM